MNVDDVLSKLNLMWKPLSGYQQEGFRQILTQMSNDTRVNRQTCWMAYMLATAWHETAFTMHPIDEKGGADYFEKRYGHDTEVGKRLGNTNPGDGSMYHGRGYVQLTGKSNYKKAGEKLGLDLIHDPDSIKEPVIAYKVMSTGMLEGWFTGRALKHYMDGVKCDYVNARRIINGIDKADQIAAYAERLQVTLI